MRPTGYPTDREKKASGVPQKPRWRKSENCPQGTVPIRRTLKSDLQRAQSLESFGRRRPPQYTFATNNAGAHEKFEPGYTVPKKARLADVAVTIRLMNALGSVGD